MSVPVSWVLGQSDLGLRLLGGAAGVTRQLDLVLTSELVDPARWLSGGELVLTTGPRLAPDPPAQAGYLRALNERGIAGLGFGTGLSHPGVPAGLIAAADEIGLALVEVPLRTPFAVIVKRVNARLAELRYEAVLRASRAQPRLTRAIVSGGAAGLAGELARALAATVLVLDTTGVVQQSRPGPLPASLLAEVGAAVTGPVGAGTSTTNGGRAIAFQRVGVGARQHGHLVVVRRTPLDHIDQILLGHATSLLALDLEKPARLRAAQDRVNADVLALLLSGASDPADPRPALDLLGEVADQRGRIRVLVVDAPAEPARHAVVAAATDVIDAAGLPVFRHADAQRVVIVLPAAVASEIAGRIVAAVSAGLRKSLRAGLGGPHAVSQLARAVEGARLTAATGAPGGRPVEAGELAGRALLTDQAGRSLLTAVADSLLTPVEEHDRVHGTHLLDALRAYLEANGHWDTAASASGVHRHTLRKRIATARSLLACDLDVARVRAELLLAILARG